MKHKHLFMELLMTFFVVTACITILQGIVGCIFRPNELIRWDAFFSPPIFGFLSTLLSLVTYSSKELTIHQEIFRRVLYLVLLEAMVLGLNIMAGHVYSWNLWIAIFLSVAVIYITANIVLYMNDQRSAEEFNAQLKTYQEHVQSEI